MAEKQCALGHEPRSLVHTGGFWSSHQCPVCDARYRWNGTGWIQVSPSAIIEDQQRFTQLIEDRRAALSRELSDERSKTILRSTTIVRDAIGSLGDAVRDSAALQAMARVYAEQLRQDREDARQVHQHSHERRLWRDGCSLRLFQLAFAALSRGEKRQVVEAAFRIRKCECEIGRFEQTANFQACRDPALFAIRSELEAIKISCGSVDRETFNTDETVELANQEATLSEALIIQNAQLKTTKVGLFQLLLSKILPKLVHAKLDLQKIREGRNRLEKDRKMVRRKLIELRSIARENELKRCRTSLALVESRCVVLEQNLMQTVRTEIMAFSRKILAWRDESLNALPPHIQPLAWKMTEVFDDWSD